MDRVLILGYQRTGRSVIEKHIRLKEDVPLSTAEMIETEQELHNLGIFDLAAVAPQNPESAAGYQNVVARVTEGQRYIWRYGIGYPEREKLRGITSINSPLNPEAMSARREIFAQIACQTVR